MIEAKAPGVGALASRLARKARVLGTAHAEARARAQRYDPLRWRMPRLLWPLFGDR